VGGVLGGLGVLLNPPEGIFIAPGINFPMICGIAPKIDIIRAEAIAGSKIVTKPIIAVSLGKVLTVSQRSFPSRVNIPPKMSFMA
jgi:hypothetical protein